MGVLLLPFRSRGFVALLVGLLPAMREVAQATWSRARDQLTRVREQYHTGQRHAGLVPTVSRLDPVVLFRNGPCVRAGRLARVLVVARPMGP